MIKYSYIFISGIAGSNAKTITNCTYICDDANEDYQYSITFLSIKGLGYSSSSTRYYINGIAYSSSTSVIENCNHQFTSGKTEKKESP